MKTVEVTSSSLASWRKCPKQYEYRYVLGFTPAKTPKPLAVGSATHQGIEVFNKGGSVTEALLAASVLATMLGLDAHEGQRVAAMIEGYYNRYSADRLALGALLVEEEFVFELAPGVVVRGKRDCTAIGAQTYNIETKTCGNLDENYWQRVTYDTQTILYEESLRHEGHDDIVTLYDVISKPALRPKKKETALEFRARLQSETVGEPAKYYFRREIYRTQDIIQSTLDDAVHTAREIAQATRYVRSDRNCAFCDFAGVCAGIQQIDGPDFVQIGAHSELSKSKTQSEKRDLALSHNKESKHGSNCSEAGQQVRLPI